MYLYVKDIIYNSAGAQRRGHEILLGVANNFTQNEKVIYYIMYIIL